jgi:hypothetical protein
MTVQQFNSLPQSVCKGGNQWKMGRGRNFVCGLCLTVGHTLEFCAAKNGYVQGGPPIRSNPNNLVPSSDNYNRAVEYRARQIQSSFDVQSFSIPRANATFQSDLIRALAMTSASERFLGGSIVPPLTWTVNLPSNYWDR